MKLLTCVDFTQKRDTKRKFRKKWATKNEDTTFGMVTVIIFTISTCYVVKRRSLFRPKFRFRIDNLSTYYHFNKKATNEIFEYNSKFVWFYYTTFYEFEYLKYCFVMKIWPWIFVYVLGSSLFNIVLLSKTTDFKKPFIHQNSIQQINTIVTYNLFPPLWKIFDPVFKKASWLTIRVEKLNSTVFDIGWILFFFLLKIVVSNGINGNPMEKYQESKAHAESFSNFFICQFCNMRLGVIILPEDLSSICGCRPFLNNSSFKRSSCSQ